MIVRLSLYRRRCPKRGTAYPTYWGASWIQSSDFQVACFSSPSPQAFGLTKRRIHFQPCWDWSEFLYGMLYDLGTCKLMGSGLIPQTQCRGISQYTNKVGTIHFGLHCVVDAFASHLEDIIKTHVPQISVCQFFISGLSRTIDDLKRATQLCMIAPHWKHGLYRKRL